MKNRLANKMGLVVALFMTGTMVLTPVSAFANANPDEEAECVCEIKCTEDCIDADCKVCLDDYTKCEGKAKEDETPVIISEPMGPLTPDGNLTLVDDYGRTDKAGKQFITLVTKSGNYFYLIIDRDDEGTETVHFLNMVDEADLLALMDDEQVRSIVGEKEVVEEVEPEVAETTEEVVEDAPEEPEKSKSGILALILLLALGGGGGYLYYRTSKQKKSEEEDGPDPDADYNEDEDLTDDDEDLDLIDLDAVLGEEE